MKFEPECIHKDNWVKMDLKEIRLVSAIRKVGKRHDSFLLHFYECSQCGRRIVLRQPVETHIVECDPEDLTKLTE